MHGRFDRALALAVLTVSSVVLTGPATVEAALPTLDPPALRLPPGQAAKQPRFPEDDGATVLVRLGRGASLAAVASTHGAAAGDVVRGTGFRRLTVPPERLHRTLRALRADPRVAAATLNRRRSIEATPNDPWAVKDGGQGWQQTVRLPAAWDVTKGSSDVTLAVLDTGVDLDHRDLAARLVPGRDVVHADDRPDDLNGHGTFVAGLAAAHTDNGIGVAGAAWTASLMPVQVLDDDGSGWDDDIAAGITWAADHGADVINLSFGGAGDSPVLAAAVEHARAQGALVVAAAGNDGSDEPEYPAATAGVLAVTATDLSGQFAWFSNWGDHVDLAAPGMDVVGLQIAEGTREPYARDSGTSFSAPIVAGAAALVRAQHPTWTGDAVAARLRDTARDAGPLGTDPYYGAGVLDAAAATGAAASPPPVLPAHGGDASEPNDTPDRTTAVALTANFAGRFAPEGDVDWYSVQVPSTGWLYVGADKRSAFDGERTEETDVAIELYGPDLQKLGEADGQGPAGTNEELFHYVRTPGRYYVRAHNALGSQGTYTIGVTQGTTPDVTDARLTAGQWYPTGSWPSTVAIGDVTGDGRRDVLMTTTDFGDADPSRDHKLFVFAQDEDGWLKRPRILDVDGVPASVATGDVDGDGRTDAIVSTGLGVEILHQRAGALADGERVFTGAARDADVVDLDGDGDLDLVTSGGGRIRRAVRTSTGWTVQPVASLPDGEVEVGDVTGDGRPDVVAIEAFGVYVIAATSTGRWADPVRYGGPQLQCQCLRGLEVAELNGDGRLDVAVTNPSAGTVAVLAQTTAGTLGAPATIGSSANPEPLESGDLDGDGRADLVTPDGGYQALSVFRRTGAATFAPRSAYRVPYASHYETTGVAVGDVTGDGRPDVVLADNNHGLVVNRNAEGTWPSAANGAWVRSVTPADGTRGVATGETPTVRFGRALDASTVTTTTVRLSTAAGAVVASSVAYDATSRTATIRPSAALAAGAYVLRVAGVRSGAGATMPGAHVTRFRVGTVSDTTPPDTVIDALTRRTVSTSAAKVAFHATEPGATFACALDGGAYEPCESPWWVFGDTLGTHTVRVRATDTAGNVDPTPAQRTFAVFDFYAYPANDLLPNAPTLGGESGTASGTNRAAGKDEFEMEHADNPGGASVWWRWTAPRRGPVTFETTGSDFDTLLGVSTGPVDMTREPFQDVKASNDDAAAGVTTSRVTFVAEAGQTYNVAVDGFNALGYGPAEGSVTLRWAMAAPPTDTTAPNTTVTEAPPSPTSRWASTRFRFTATEAGATFECRRGTVLPADGGWRTCASGRTEDLFEGDWTFEVRAVDAAGNRDPTPAVHRWTIDTTAPVVTALTGTAGTTASTNASFGWQLDDSGASAQCRLDAGAWQACTTPRAYTGLAEGHHRFDVRGVDPAGNAGTLASSSWTIDPAAPTLDTKLWGGPSGQTNDRFAFFEFSSTRPDARFVCRLDAGTWTPCTSPYYLDGLGDGERTFAVRAIDGTEEDPTPATRTWTVGQPPPLDTSITAGPSGLVASRGASFSFTATRAAATFECRVDAAAFAPCSSPFVASGLADGSHSFEVRAVDGATTDTTPASRTWTVDATAPAVAITGGPSGAVASRDASISFTAESGAALACRLDAGTFATCTSPTAYTGLPDGSHTFTVRATDAAGNAATASRSWTIQQPPPPPAPPDTTITSGPTGLTAARSATIAFSGTGVVDRYECRLDEAAWATCASPRTLEGLADGAHAFDVRAVNAGGADATPARRAWAVDATPPDTTVTSSPPGESEDTTPTFAFSATEGGASFTCRVDDGPAYPCTSPHTTAPVGVGAHRFAVVAKDVAGNVDASAAVVEFTVAPAPAPAPAPQPPLLSEASGQPARDVVAPRLLAFRPLFAREREVVRLRVTTDEPGVVSVRFERCRARGRIACAVRRRAGSAARRVPKGSSAFRLTAPKLAAGRYRLTATITDDASNTSARRTATLVVRARRRG